MYLFRRYKFVTRCIDKKVFSINHEFRYCRFLVSELRKLNDVRELKIDERHFASAHIILDASVRVWDIVDAILHTPDPRDSEHQFEYGSTTFPWVSMFPRETAGRMSTSCCSFTYSSDQETLLRCQQDYLRNCKRFRLTIQPCYRGTRCKLFQK